MSSAKSSKVEHSETDRVNMESAEDVDDGVDGGQSSEESGSEEENGQESGGESHCAVRNFRSRTSSVYSHLAASPDCYNSYSDSCFTVLCRGRHGDGLRLNMLGATCQRLCGPGLCVQGGGVVALGLFG
eukprot:scpid109334/ scgid24656/ 